MTGCVLTLTRRLGTVGMKWHFSVGHRGDCASGSRGACVA